MRCEVWGVGRVEEQPGLESIHKLVLAGLKPQRCSSPLHSSPPVTEPTSSGQFLSWIGISDISTSRGVNELHRKYQNNKRSSISNTAFGKKNMIKYNKDNEKKSWCQNQISETINVNVEGGRKILSLRKLERKPSVVQLVNLIESRNLRKTRTLKGCSANWFC